MKFYTKLVTLLLMLTSLSTTAIAAEIDAQEFDPADPLAEQILKDFDKAYEQQTGIPAWLEGSGMELLQFIGG